MEKQEELEEEENMPAEEPDPLVLDEDGKVVPASAASWTEETQEPENVKEQGMRQCRMIFLRKSRWKYRGNFRCSDGW